MVTHMNPAILLVDDEPSICSALYRTFRKNQFTVYEANSAKQALKILENQKVDVVLSDQKMPEMTGTELLTIVKNSYPKVGRIILSGHSDMDDLVDAINEASISQFLPKPWDEKKLIDVVNTVITPRTLDQKAKIIPFALPNDSSVSSKRDVFSKSTFEYIPQNFTTHHDRPIDIASAISNNALVFSEQSYLTKENINKTLSYLTLQWPDFPRLHHEGVINIAQQTGYLPELFAWYVENIHRSLDQYNYDDKRVVIDLFFSDFLQSDSLMQPVNSLLEKHDNIIFRVPFDILRHPEFPTFLFSLYQQNGHLLLNLEKRVIDLSELVSTPVQYIEMDNRLTTINNHLLTEKRLEMLEDAQRFHIKTILLKAQQQVQYNYARSMGFDFF